MHHMDDWFQNILTCWFLGGLTALNYVTQMLLLMVAAVSGVENTMVDLTCIFFTLFTTLVFPLLYSPPPPLLQKPLWIIMLPKPDIILLMILKLDGIQRHTQCWIIPFAQNILPLDRVLFRVSPQLFPLWLIHSHQIAHPTCFFARFIIYHYSIGGEYRLLCYVE